MKKQVFYKYIMALVVVFSLIGCASAAGNNVGEQDVAKEAIASEADAMKDTETGQTASEQVDDNEITNVNESEENLDADSNENINDDNINKEEQTDYGKGNTNNEENIDIPSKYSLVDEGLAPGVRNQEMSSLCWVFTANTIAESNVIKKGFEDADTVDFSEGYIVTYVYDFEEDLADDFTKDSMMYTCDKNVYATTPYTEGGNTSIVLLKYASGTGPVDESVAPLNLKRAEYADSVKAINEAADNGTINNQMAKYIVTDMDILDEDKYEEQIKREILEKGAVGIGMNLFYTGNGKLYEDPANSSEDSNHVTSIIGWDDEYSRDNFGLIKPSSDGAWLVQDSTRYVGTDGYFWMSYENKIYGAFAVNLEKRDKYGKVLVYDDLGPGDYIRSGEGATIVANVFNAEENNTLTAIGIITCAAKQEVELSVYKNPEEGKPDSGQLQCVITVSPEYQGYHVIDLEEEVSLSAGDIFSIVASYKGDKEAYGFVGVDGDNDKANLYVSDDKKKVVLQAKPGQSYGCVNGIWYDMVTSDAAKAYGYDGIINNVCIRALLGL